MKSKFSCIILALVLLAAALPLGASAAESKAAPAGKAVVFPPMRVVVDGAVKAYGGVSSGGSLYFSSGSYNDIIARMGKKAPKSGVKTLTYNNGTYYSLMDVCKALNVSYEHDTRMEAVYIWTAEPYLKQTVSEIQRAVSLGLVPKDLQGDYDRQITFKENAKLAEALINLTDKTLMGKLKEKLPKALDSDKKMSRGHGMAVIAYAATVMGLNSFNYDWPSINDKIGSKCWDELGLLDWSLFPAIFDEPNPIKNSNGTIEKWAMYAGMYFYSFGRKSLVTQKTLFDYDTAKNSMRPNDPFTRRDAINAVIRLYDSREDSGDKAAALDAARKYNKLIITPDLLKNAAKMPEPTLEKLPYYAGLTYNNCAIPEWYENDVKKASQWGFNYMRIRARYDTFFNNDVTTADEEYLEKLDKLISWGLKYRVHIDFQVTEFPGWKILKVNNDTSSSAELDYFFSREHQLQTLRMWSVFAERYKDIPNSALTFSINHEPFNTTLTTDSPPSKHTYADIVKTAKEVWDTIHKIDSDRLMFTESGFSWTMDYLPLAKDLPVVNTFKASDADDFPYWNLITDYRNSSGFFPDWPMVTYAANPFIFGSRGANAMKDLPLVMDGTLPKDTKITLHLKQIDGSGDFSVLADGKEILAEKFDPKVGQDGCIGNVPGSELYTYETSRPEAGGRSTTNEISKKTVAFTLPSDTKKLEFAYKGVKSGWISWCGINVVLPEKYGIDRWYYTSAADNIRMGKGDSETCIKRKTSEIIVSPLGELAAPLPVTIHPDVTYSTPVTAKKVDREAIRAGTEKWVNQAKASGMSTVLCNEFVTFRGNTSENISTYFDDLLSVYNQYNIGWVYFGAYNGTIYDSNSIFALEGPANEFDVNTLKALQRHQQPASARAQDSIARAEDLGLLPRLLDGDFQQNITLAEFCALAVPFYEKAAGKPITKLKEFAGTTDINIRKINGLGILTGMGDGAPNPNSEINRQEVAVILGKLMAALGKPLPAANPAYSDKAQIDAWAKVYVGQIQAAGIMSSKGTGSFKPKGDTGKYTREQSIVSFVLLWDLLNK